MASVQIPNLPLVFSLNGAEQIELVQNGISVRATTSQFAKYISTIVPSQLPAGEAIFRAKTISGSANAISIVSNGMPSLTSTPSLILVFPAVNNTGPATIAFDNSPLIPLLSPLGVSLNANEFVAGLPHFLSVTITSAIIFASGATW